MLKILPLVQPHPRIPRTGLTGAESKDEREAHTVCSARLRDTLYLPWDVIHVNPARATCFWPIIGL